MAAERNSRLARVARGAWLSSNADLAVIVIVTLCAVGAVLLNLPPFVRLALALPLALFIPGYVLQAALMAARPLPTLEQVLISLGASIALTILVGLILAVATLGLAPETWVIGLAAWAVLGSSITALRRRAVGLRGPRLKSFPGRMRSLMPLGLAALALLAVVLGTRFIAVQEADDPPVQLWLVPADDGSPIATLGVGGGPPGEQYVLRVTSAGVLLAEFNVSIEAGQIWQQPLVLDREQRQRPVVARLYTPSSEIELRFVVLQPLDDAN